jgi:tetratricopeptide (TPR) repeat protein
MRRVLAVIAVVLVVGGLAHAQKPTAAQRKAAKAHFDQGRAYYDAGAWDDAVREYEAAYRLAPLPELQFNIGQALRMKGDKPKAIAAYQRYLEATPEGPLAEEARNHVAALRLKITIDEAEAARRKADEEAAAAKARAAEAEAARRRAEAQATAKLRDDDERLRRVAAEEAEAGRRHQQVVEEVRKRRVDEAGGAGSALRVTGIVTIVAGVLLVGGGAATLAMGLSSRKELDQFNSDPNQYWHPEYDSNVNDIRTFKGLSPALFGVGAALVVTGATLYAVGARRRAHAVEKARTSVSFAPAVSPSAAALALGGTF